MQKWYHVDIALVQKWYHFLLQKAQGQNKQKLQSKNQNERTIFIAIY